MPTHALTHSGPLHRYFDRALDPTQRQLADLRRSLRRQNVPLLAMLSLMLGLLSAMLAYLIEGGPAGVFHSLGDAAWWVVVSMSTTGYGDVVPQTGAGRLLAAVTILSGMGLLSLFTASTASILTARRIQEDKGLQKVKAHHHVVICGWNGHAQRVIEGLIHGGGRAAPEIVLVNQLAEETIADVLHLFRHERVSYVRGDFCQETVLRRANVEAAAAAIVLADASAGTTSKMDDRTVLAVLAIRSINSTLKVCAEIAEAENEVHLRRAGVDDVVVSGEHNGFLLSSAAIAPGLPQLVRELLAFHSPHGLRRRPIPPGFAGKTFGELAFHLRQMEGAILIGLISGSPGVTLNDLISGDYSSVDLFIKQQFANAGMEYLTLTREQAEVRVNPPDDQVLAEGDQAILLSGGLD